MNILKIIVLVCLFAGSACAGPTLSAAGKSVKLKKKDPPDECEELGIVEQGWTVGGCDMNCQQTGLKNKAAALGANYVRWDTVLASDTNASGTAFKCP